MAVATIILSASLTLDVELRTGITNPAAGEGARLNVHIRKRTVDQSSELTSDKQAIPQSIEDEVFLNESEPAEVANTKHPVTRDPVDPPIGSEPARDWNALAEKFAKESVDEYFRREDARASMWQQTRSVMFKPDNDFRVNEEAPLLANIKFREPVGVIGLGITIGSCFIGIPIAGVPVEERSIGITLFVCRKDSG